MPTAEVNWGSVADWVSGIGSLCAGIIALYLARSSQRIRLKGYVGIRTIISQGAPPRDILSISVTNVGTRSTIINNIGLSTGWLKKRQGVITVVKDVFSSGIPFALADGQDGHWGIPIDKEKTWLQELTKSFLHTERDIKSLRFHAYTSHGERLTIKPEESLKKELARLLAAKDA